MSRSLITGIARLDNRDELCGALGLGPDERRGITDLGLALRAYERWGVGSPERMRGDFSYVVVDTTTRTTFAARDQLGATPFYYRVSGGRLAFALSASGVPAIDGLPVELDEARIADALVPQLECADATSTFFRGVSRLPPAHRLLLEDDRLTVSRYWEPGSAQPLRLSNDGEREEAFRAAFAEAVRCRLTGPTASMLSGGLDSSAIVGFARGILKAEGRDRLTTLSAVTSDPGCEESRHVRSVLALSDLEPVLLRVEDVGSHRDTIERFVESMEEPFDGTMFIPLLLYRAARDRGFDAVLDGVDGDVVASVEPEILAELIRRGAWGRAAREARGIAAFYQGTYAPWSSTSRLLFFNAVRLVTPGPLRRARRVIRRPREVRGVVNDSLIHQEFASRINLSDRLRDGVPPEVDPVCHPRIGAALERYFRVARSQSIQPRHPFLDLRVVELCRSLPWSSRLRDGWSKWIVRRAASGLLPDDVLWRRGRWVRLGPQFLEAAVRASSELVRREMSASPGPLAPYVDPSGVRAVYDAYRHGDRAQAETIWRLAVLSTWLRNFAVTRYDAAARANGPAALPCLPFAG